MVNFTMTVPEYYTSLHLSTHQLHPICRPLCGLSSSEKTAIFPNMPNIWAQRGCSPQPRGSFWLDLGAFLRRPALVGGATKHSENTPICGFIYFGLFKRFVLRFLCGSGTAYSVIAPIYGGIVARTQQLKAVFGLYSLD